MNHNRQLSWGLALLLNLLLALVAIDGISQPVGPAPSITAAYIKANYVKQVHFIPMRDGIRLHTIVYVPKAVLSGSIKAPILINRTPYGVGPYEKDSMKPNLGPNPYTVAANYIFAYQDVRGKYLSGGFFEDMRAYRGPHNHAKELAAAKKKPKEALIDEATDTYDAVDWLVKNIPNNNSRVGFWGISYPGFYASMAALDAHPAVKAVSPQAPVADWWTGDDFRRRGVFLTQHAFNFFNWFGQERESVYTQSAKPFKHPTPDGYKFFLEAGSSKSLGDSYLKKPVPFWQQLISHEDYDTFWVARSSLQYFKQVKPAMLVVGGFYDTENLFGAIQVYESTKRQSPGTHAYLTLGPWWHGQWGRDSGNHIANVRFGANTSFWYHQNIEYPFFRHYLDQEGKGKAPIAQVNVFDDGKNQWLSYNQWPGQVMANGMPTQLVKFNLHPDNSLKRDQPATGGEVTYTADPMHPVPYTQLIATGLEKSYMIDDQRHNTSRPDVVTFTTNPLRQDLVVSGKAVVRLKIKSTAEDADFFVKVIDVHPDDVPADSPLKPAGPEKSNYHPAGYQQLIRWDAIRARYRKSYSQPEPLVPGQEAELVIPLNHIAHTFKQGHRLMLQVQSSWFPLTERHPQKYIPVHSAQPQDYQKADHTIILPASYLELELEGQ